MKLLKSGAEDVETLVVGTIAAVAKNFGLFKALLGGSLGKIKDDGGFDFVASASSNRHNLIFFACPTADR